MQTFKEACSIFVEQWFLIVVILLGFVLPIQLIHFSLGTLAYTSWVDLPILGGLTDVGLFLLEIWLVQIPFITIAMQRVKGEKARLGEVLNRTIVYLVPVFALGLLYTLGVLAGLTLFILPGYMCLIILLLFPQVIVAEGLTVWSGLKRASNLGKKYFFQLSIVVFSFLLTEALLSIILYYGLGLGAKANLFTLLMLRIVLESLLLPLFAFMTTLLYVEWTQKPVAPAPIDPKLVTQGLINDRMREVFSRK